LATRAVASTDTVLPANAPPGRRHRDQRERPRRSRSYLANLLSLLQPHRFITTITTAASAASRTTGDSSVPSGIGGQQ
jgi:hypothetical protein